MKLILRLSLASALISPLSLAPALAGTDPLVIPGLGPEDQVLPEALPRRRADLRQTAARAAPVASAGRYGGGFIELLMTGQAQGRPIAMSAASMASRQPLIAVPLRGPARNDARRVPAALMAYAPVEAALRRVLDPRFERQEVDYGGGHAPGTIVIDTPNKFLYLVENNGRALRYGIGVGRPGFEWSGVKSISRKAKWPAWTPPAEMLLRRPDLPRHMEGGPQNPLGARAIYLGSSLYRIHGTNEPQTIGTNVSSGCIRLTNDAVTDLFDRVKIGAKVIVM